MSNKAIAWALDQRKISSDMFVFLVRLSDRHSEDYGVYISQAELIQMTGFSKTKLGDLFSLARKRGLLTGRIVADRRFKVELHLKQMSSAGVLENV